MEIIKEIVNAYGLEILGAILTALAGVLGLAVKNLATKYINTSVKRSVARTVVQGVEQIYKDLHGKEKLDKALEAAAAMLLENGIYVTDLELRMLIEAAVGEFNQVFTAQPLLEIADGIDVDDMTDDQLRAVLAQIGRPAPMSFTREDMLAALDEAAEIANT